MLLAFACQFRGLLRLRIIERMGPEALFPACDDRKHQTKTRSQ